MSIQRVALSDIVANHYRKIESYRISEEKIEALIQSYDNSGFWDGSLQARPHPTKTGKYEIAFGHHRVEAARRYKKLAEVGLVVAKRSNADMLRMMADENREEFKGDQLVAIETIAATIEAFGRGEIELAAVAKDTNKAHIYALAGARAYTLPTVAQFLGWLQRNGEPTRACRLAFAAYHSDVLAQIQKLPEDDRTREATNAVMTAATSARAIAKRAGKSPSEMKEAARAAAKETVSRIRDGGIASTVRREARKIGRAAAGVKRTAPEITQFVEQRTEGLRTRIVNLEAEVNGLLSEVLPYRQHIEPDTLAHLLDTLKFGDDRIRGLFQRWIEKFEKRQIRDVTPRRRLLNG